MPPKSRVVRHPSTDKLFRKAAHRWLHLKQQHEYMARRLWLGIMATEFADTELSLLTDYISESDRAFLKKAGRLNG